VKIWSRQNHQVSGLLVSSVSWFHQIESSPKISKVYIPKVVSPTWTHPTGIPWCKLSPHPVSAELHQSSSTAAGRASFQWKSWPIEIVDLAIGNGGSFHSFLLVMLKFTRGCAPCMVIMRSFHMKLGIMRMDYPPLINLIKWALLNRALCLLICILWSFH